MPAVTPPAPQQPPASTPYIVREGDSLWKIFRSLGRDQKGGRAWEDFLFDAQELNNLSDPDTIHPGKVLKLVAPAR
jgi:LysM repeat protein